MEAQLAGDPQTQDLTYIERYGLVEAPFTLTPNPRFVYQSRSHSAVFTEVLSSINRREGLIVITGEIGAGKTTLCRTLLQHLTPRTFASVILNPLLGADDLLKQILSDFGLISGDATGTAAVAGRKWHDLVTMLHRFLASLIQVNAHAVIVIDEAQHLDPQVLEQIRLLSNFETDTAKLLQIVLLGQPDLDSLLDRPDMRQLAQRVSRRCRLEPLTRAEVGRYIDRRLWVAHGGPSLVSANRVTGGADPDSGPRPVPAEFWRIRFTPAAVRTVAEISSGIPRVVNLLCDRALEIGAESELRAIGPATVLAAAERLALPVPIGSRLSRWRWPITIAGASTAAVAGVAIAMWLLWPSLTRLGSTGPRESAPPQPTPTASAVPSPSAPPPAAPTAGVLETADSHLVAVASFKTRSRADEVVRQAAALGLPAFVRPDSSGEWHVVLVGPYLSRGEAVGVQQRLSESGFRDSRVIVESPATVGAKGAS